MNELIKVTNGLVNARDLHQFVVVEAKGGQTGEDFSTWIKRMLEFDFVLGKDYSTVGYNYLGEIIEENGAAQFRESDNQSVRVAKRDYALTLPTAKEIAMLQNNDRGRLARRYFIACEEKLKARPQLMTTEELIIAQAQSVMEVKKKVAVLEDRVNELTARTATRPDVFTVVGYATLHNLPKISLTTAANVGKKAAQMAREQNIELDSVPDPRFGRVRRYPSALLEQAFALVMPGITGEA